MVKGLNPCLLRLYDEYDTRHILQKQYGLEKEGCVLIIGFDGMKKIVETQEEVSYLILEKNEGKDLGEELAVNWWNNRYRSYYPPLDYISNLG